jgi:hypothetical protein
MPRLCCVPTLLWQEKTGMIRELQQPTDYDDLLQSSLPIGQYPHFFDFFIFFPLSHLFCF